ncbi:inorganic phosphate transporter [Achlya hypogyna]|uniref:Phosphate transporter n=1 Tax=Achlya hypogyna TaxID=1202772 RepID=A0A1V9ZTU6_ACHHY|nr:inorganic phosphate transporter [Achlya hypogyna]
MPCAGLPLCAYEPLDPLCVAASNDGGIPVGIVVLGGVLLLILSFVSTANDMVNIVGTAVASQAIVARRALTLGGLVVFAGYLLAAASVSTPLTEKVGGLSVAQTCWHHGLCDTREVAYADGLIVALCVTVALVGIATLVQVPLSTTHILMGGLIGMALTSGGGSCTNPGGLHRILASTIAAPLLSAAVSTGVYSITARWVLNVNLPQFQALSALPWFFGVSVAATVALVLYRAGPLLPTPPSHHLFYQFASLVAGLGVGAFVRCSLVPYVQRHLPSLLHGGEPCNGVSRTLAVSAMSPFASVHDFAVLERESLPSYLMDSTFTRDADDDVPSLGDPDVSVLQRSTLEWTGDYYCLTPPQRDAYYVFNYALLLLTTLSALLYGICDGANAIAVFNTLATLYGSHLDGGPYSKLDSPLWINGLVGAAAALGAFAGGRRVLARVLHDACFVNPHRGFCMQSGTWVVLFAAALLDVPVSSTHCALSAIAAVSHAHYGCWKVDRARFTWYAISWAFSLPVSMAVVAAVTYILQLYR